MLRSSIGRAKRRKTASFQLRLTRMTHAGAAARAFCEENYRSNFLCAGRLLLEQIVGQAEDSRILRSGETLLAEDTTDQGHISRAVPENHGSPYSSRSTDTNQRAGSSMQVE